MEDIQKQTYIDAEVIAEAKNHLDTYIEDDEEVADAPSLGRVTPTRQGIDITHFNRRARRELIRKYNLVQQRPTDEVSLDERKKGRKLRKKRR